MNETTFLKADTITLNSLAFHLWLLASIKGTAAALK